MFCGYFVGNPIVGDATSEDVSSSWEQEGCRHQSHTAQILYAGSTVLLGYLFTALERLRNITREPDLSTWYPTSVYSEHGIYDGEKGQVIEKTVLIQYIHHLVCCLL